MSAGMIRFDQGARKALLQSHVEAEEARQSKVMDLHLLIALVKDEGQVGKILAEQGADQEKFRLLVDEALPASEKMLTTREKIDLDVSVQGVLEQAMRIARQKKSETLGSEHLLFALVKSSSSLLKLVMDAARLDRSQILERLEPLLSVPSSISEFRDLLATLEACRELLRKDTIAQARLIRIEEILREYFSVE